MESSLKNLLNNSNASTIPGIKKKEKKQIQKQTQEKTEDCTKNLFSLPSSVLSENFTEKIKKENLQKLDNNENSEKSAKAQQATISNPLKNLLSENAAKNSAAKTATKNPLVAEKLNFASVSEAASKLQTANAPAPIKDLNVSSIEYAADEVSKLNLNNSLANLLSAAAHSNLKINENLISLNNNNCNYNNLNSNITNSNNANANKKQNSNLIANAPNSETAQLNQNHQEFSTKGAQINQIQIPSSAQSANSKADLKTLNAEEIIPEETLTVVPKPRNMKISSYIERQVDVYSNLYPIRLTKNYSLFTYFIDFQGDSEHINTFLKRKIISKAYLDLIPIFGIYFFSGENFYATEKIKDVTNVISTYNKVKYSFLIRPVGDFFEMKDYNANLKNKSLFKNILELIYKDILKANPDVKMIKNMCGKKCTEKIVTSKDNKVLVIPAFSTKIMLLEAGIFLNVDNKNKILNGEDCLKLIKQKIRGTKPNANETRLVNDLFRDRIVETKHTNQRFKIDSVSFDRSPKNTNLNVDGNNIPMSTYYKKLYGFTVEENQPLLLLKNPAQRKTNVGRYYPAELCFLSGLTDQMVADGKLMMNISKNTKLNPEQKVEEIDTILTLLNATSKKTTRDGVVLPSSSEKMSNYGVKILKTTENSFKGYTMKPPVMIGGENEALWNIMKPFKILDAKQINYICLYHKLYEVDMKVLDSAIHKAGVSYGIKLGNKCENIQMNSENTDEWIKTIRAKLDTRQFNFVFILLDDYLQLEGFYSPLKKHSLETMGYPMQVILTNSLYKNTMSVVSNILLQANSKLGGSLFKIQIPKEIRDKNLMVVGIDISALKGQNRLNIAMCATTNPELTEYYSSKSSVPIEQDGQTNRNLCYNVSAFIHEAVMEFFKKNKSLPKGVVIYRQGVSKEQRAYLTEEVSSIEKMLAGKSENQLEQEIYERNPIPYYYVLVNKKTSLKFFEKEKAIGKYEYSNPECGLLILNDLTDTDSFEFYVQPQKVNQGTATPTNFHVAYGNLNMPEYIPKITYDLCYMYSNWRGPVRVPAPLKYAEKLAKAEHNLHQNSKLKLYHL